MPWAKFSDDLATNAKIAALSDRAFRVWVYSVVLCAQNLTDGVLSEALQRMVLGLAGAPATRSATS
jgi:hypothetical protein